jgi:pyruvate dehydrogenase E1 component alpha subunit
MVDTVDDQVVLQLYEMMFLIRSAEERIKKEYSSRNIRMPVHLSIGQEGVATGVLMAARRSDCCVSTHRCHAHYLVKGGNLSEMIDEFYSLETGCSRGYGGSMHLFDKKVNMWGSGAIVGGVMPVSVGIGLALKQAGTDNLCIGFSGDGAADQGVFYESLNLAALLQVPVLFVVENNGYSVLTPQVHRQASPNIVLKARSFGVDGMTVDGNDVIEVYRTTQEISDIVRKTSRPFLLEAVTYRLCSHVGPGADFGIGRRPKAELTKWKARDPLGLLRKRIEQQMPNLSTRLVEIEKQVSGKVDSAFQISKLKFKAINARINLPAPEPPDPSKV